MWRGGLNSFSSNLTAVCGAAVPGNDFSRTSVSLLHLLLHDRAFPAAMTMIQMNSTGG